MNAKLITDSAAPLTEVMRALDALHISTNGVVIRYRRDAVAVTLDGATAARADEVWELLMLEFGHAGWGYHTAFRNGMDAPRTGMTFTHPSTLTRIG